MFRDQKSQDYFFRVQCGGVETMVLSHGPSEAASEGLKKIIEKFGENTQLSFVMSVDKVTNDNLEIEIFSTPEILADCGFFSLSKELLDLRNFFLDKDKKSS
tara:strand:+ start:152 stop:457 length:306 start_codon:yes stop_codon:yes gene_type:complete